MRICFVVSAFLFLYMILKVLPGGTRSPTPAFETALTVVALGAVVMGFVLPRMLAARSQRTTGNANHASPLQFWVLRSVMGFAFIEACSLFGVALHAMGADLRRSELLIGIGIVATVFFSAGEAPADESNPGTS
jgi:hypothetical protein